MNKSYVFLILVFLIFIAGCNSNQINNPSISNNVEINSLDFSQSELTIKIGETVTWINKDSVKHTITSDSGNELNSDLVSASQTYSHTFNNLGIYNYHCSVHSGMTGKIIVE